MSCTLTFHRLDTETLFYPTTCIITSLRPSFLCDIGQCSASNLTASRCPYRPVQCIVFHVRILKVLFLCGLLTCVELQHNGFLHSVQKTICRNSTSNPPDDGRMYPKLVELRIHQSNYLVSSSWRFTLFREVPTSPLHRM